MRLTKKTWAEKWDLLPSPLPPPPSLQDPVDGCSSSELCVTDSHSNLTITNNQIHARD